MNQWDKWRADLTALGGWDNELVSVPAGPVREMIVAGQQAMTLIDELAQAVEDDVTELGGCDHDTGICMCFEKNLVRRARELTGTQPAAPMLRDGNDPKT